MAQTILEYLRMCLKQHIKSTDESMLSIANSIGIDYQKLYRLRNGELKNINFHDANLITSFINPSDGHQKLKESFPAESKDLPSHVQLQSSNEALRAVSKTPQMTEIYIYVSEKIEAYFEDVAREYGNRGLQLLDELIRKGAITKEENGRLLNGIDGQISADDEILTALYKNYKEIADTEEPGHLLRLFSKGLNDEGRKKVYGIIAEASSAIAETIATPQYQGGEVYLATLMCGQLTAAGQLKEAKHDN